MNINYGYPCPKYSAHIPHEYTGEISTFQTDILTTGILHIDIYPGCGSQDGRPIWGWRLHDNASLSFCVARGLVDAHRRPPFLSMYRWNYVVTFCWRPPRSCCGTTTYLRNVKKKKKTSVNNHHHHNYHNYRDSSITYQVYCQKARALTLEKSKKRISGTVV